MKKLTRRHFIATGVAAGAATPIFAQETATPASAQAEAVLTQYAPVGYAIPPQHMPRLVEITTPLAPFEIHVDRGGLFLYWTLPNGQAVRYVVGIGRGNLYEPGDFFIGAKKEWPSWTPTQDMIARNPGAYAQYADGMPGGPSNPLGARALYLFTPQQGDTFLRIHGTPEPATVGGAVSNGCVRLINDHIVHLYQQVPLNTRAVLHV